MVTIAIPLGSAGAAESTPPAGSTEVRFAVVEKISGELFATAGENGPTRTLRKDDVVFVGERIRASGAAEAILKTDDAGLIAIRPRAEFVAEQFAADGKQSDHLSLRLLKGGLRLITGWIGRTNPRGYRVSTLTATIGIRGTDHEPYEISGDLGDELLQDEGTYDKVNRGGTTMDVNGNKLDIEPGKVGFAKRRATATVRQRGMFTITLPVLLEKIPGFYVPGQFDDDLDRRSRTADEDTLRELNTRRGTSTERSSAAALALTEKPVARPVAPLPAPTARDARAPVSGECVPAIIARAWLSEFDAAIVARDAQAIVQKFAPDVSVSVTARGTTGAPSTVKMGRDELARSTIAAVNGLTDYEQRRPSIEARSTGGAGTCDQIHVESVVIEQGRQSGNPYRFESVEEFVLVQRAGVWLAIEAHARQR